MRNRIKGYWNWEDVGILPAKLARVGTSESETAEGGLERRSDEAMRAYTPLVVAGGVVAGLALVWVIRALFRK